MIAPSGKTNAPIIMLAASLGFAAYGVSRREPSFGIRAEGFVASTPGIVIASTSRSASNAPRSDFSVTVREPVLLRQFVDETSGMRDLLSETISVLEQAFGDDATIVLEPFIDPEAVDACPRVFVLAVTHLPFERADQILDHVIETWWTANHERANGRVSLGTELV